MNNDFINELKRMTLETIELAEKYQENKNCIVINDDIFTYKNNQQIIPTRNNSFVVDLETYHNLNENQKPITTMISFSQLSYLKRECNNGFKHSKSYFCEEFNPVVYDIINDTDESLQNDYDKREDQLYFKSLDTMIKMVKKSSDSRSKRIYLYMFNNSKYDNTYFMKMLSRWGYKQIFSNSFYPIVNNMNVIKPLQDQLQQMIDDNECDTIIKQKRKQIYDSCVFSERYRKEYKLLGGDRVKYLSLEFTYRNYIFILKDFCRFYPTTLKNLGKTLQLNKLTDIGDKYYDRDFKTLTKQEWDEYRHYCKEDIHILFEGIKKYSGFLTLDKDKISTISSLTLYKWKELDENNRRYLKIDIEEDEWDIGNESYRGGFTFGNEKYLNTILHNVNTYDINSSYPSVMIQPVVCEKVDEEKYHNTTLEKTILYHIKIDKFKLRDDMLPIIPYMGRNINNSFYKDYDVDKDRQIHEYLNRNSGDIKPVFKQLKLWVWEEELEWYKKFYNDFKFEIIDRRYFLKRDLFKEYVNKNYLTKSQSDVDKLLLSIINDYIKHRDIIKVEEDINNQFPLVFNEKNTSLSKHIDYLKEGRELIYSEIDKINQMCELELSEYQEDVNNQLLYLETIRTTTKLYLNSLYGKFGQTPYNESYYIVNEELTPNNEYTIITDELLLEKQTFRIESKKQHTILDNKVYNYQRVDKLPTRGNNVYISSYIGMKGRCKLYEIIHKYGNEKVLYGDTDSIKMFGELDDSYINNSELGKWKYEGTYETFSYIGSKKYMYRDTKNKFGFTIAGVNEVSKKYKDYKINKQTQDLMFQDFCDMKIELFKKGSVTDKESGSKLIIGSKEVILNKKDNDNSYVSIDKRYDSIINKKQLFITNHD